MAFNGFQQNIHGLSTKKLPFAGGFEAFHSGCYHRLKLSTRSGSGGAMKVIVHAHNSLLKSATLLSRDFLATAFGCWILPHSLVRQRADFQPPMSYG